MSGPRLSWSSGPEKGLDLAAEQEALFAFVRVVAGAVGLNVGHPLDMIARAVLERAAGLPNGGMLPTEADRRDLATMQAFEQGDADRTPHGGGLGARGPERSPKRPHEVVS